MFFILEIDISIYLLRKTCITGASIQNRGVVITMERTVTTFQTDDYLNIKFKKKKTQLLLLSGVSLQLLTACTLLQNKTYEDGVYRGSGEGFKSTIEVEVEIKDGKISTVEVLKENETKRYAQKALDTIPEKIVKAGNTDVKIIAGATHTSRGILEAVDQALLNSDYE